MWGISYGGIRYASRQHKHSAPVSILGGKYIHWKDSFPTQEMEQLSIALHMCVETLLRVKRREKKFLNSRVRIPHELFQRLLQHRQPCSNADVQDENCVLSYLFSSLFFFLTFFHLLFQSLFSMLPSSSTCHPFTSSSASCLKS